MIVLIRKLFWFAIFLLATFCFIVIFERGTSNFSKNAREEFDELKEMFGKDIEHKPGESDKVTR
jgi:hypothetical protein